jgi:hypothetical protein
MMCIRVVNFTIFKIPSSVGNLHYFIIENATIEAKRATEPAQKVHSASNAS